MNEDFKTVIGLEIHTQLKTKSKMFCSCSNDAEDKEPNTLICPICLGMPGTLPVTNVKALELVAKIGLALGSKIAEVSWFDRKHYFYPDLPKGYQISQYQNPFCVGGSITIGGKTIRLNRVHLEEDAGKLVHPAGSEVSFVDLNRAGTPLAEIVSEPDIESPAQAKEFLKELRELLRAIEVSDADMEKGHLRCDANISVTKDGKCSPIVEIKNLNSFKFVEKALSLEEIRLREDYENWEPKQKKVTRGFNSTSGETYSLREKEEAKDYRYFPEPDIPPIELGKLIDLERLTKETNRLPQAIMEELMGIGLEEQISRQIVSDKDLLAKVEALKLTIELTARFLKTLVNEKSTKDFSIEQLIDLSSLIENNIPSNLLRQIIVESGKEGKLPSEISIKQDDTSDVIEKVLVANPDVVLKYKSGHKEVIGFLIGQVMREAAGKANPNEIRESIIKKIK